MTKLEDQFELLMNLALSKMATDIHFKLSQKLLKIDFRCPEGLISLDQDIFDPALMDFLRLKAGMDLCTPLLPQSGAFEYVFKNKRCRCRFSCLINREVWMGSLRFLESQKPFKIEDLTYDLQYRSFLQEQALKKSGLIIGCGPVGTGKTTTIHAILSAICSNPERKIVSLEDPIEIKDERYIQLEINESRGLSYSRGIEELMRHDPQVIFIGECRNETTAKMAVRAALTGTLVFMTLHAGNGEECLARLMELGVSRRDLMAVIETIMVMDLVETDHGREGIYECWNRKKLLELFENRNTDPWIPFKSRRSKKGRLD